METFFTTNNFHDIDQYMEAVTPTMDIRSIQIQPGTLSLKNHQLDVDGVYINYYSTNRDLVDRFSIIPNHVLFSLTSPTNKMCNWCGINVPVNSLGVLHPEREHQARMPALWDSFGILIKDEIIEKELLMSEEMWSQTKHPEKAIFNYQSLFIASFRSKLLSYFQSFQRLDTLSKDKFSILKFRNWILNVLRLIFLEIEDYQKSNNSISSNTSRRYQTYIRAITIIEENLSDLHSIKQICDKIGTTPRTLQLCFKELSGISPHQYLMARRLHAVQQDFFHLKNSSKSISHIAQDYGLYHAGRFSSQYERMFLELPHETLKRRNKSQT